MTDYEYGLFVFQVFINQFSAIYKKGWADARTLAMEIQPKSHVTLLDGVGLAYRLMLEDGRMNQTKLERSMRDLAVQSNGKTPTRNSFFAAIQQQSVKYTFLEAAAATATGTASELLNGAQSLGNQVITSAKFLNSILPLAIIGIVGYVGYKWTKRIGGK